MRSGIIAILTGALRNIAAEFDRRIAVGHENRRTEPSGDGDMLREYALSWQLRWPISRIAAAPVPAIRELGDPGGHLMPTQPTATLAHGVHHTEVRGRFRRPSLYGDLLRIETRVEDCGPGPSCSASNSTRKPAGSSWPKAPPPWWPSARTGKRRDCRRGLRMPWVK